MVKIAWPLDQSLFMHADCWSTDSKLYAPHPQVSFSTAPTDDAIGGQHVQHVHVFIGGVLILLHLNSLLTLTPICADGDKLTDGQK